MKLSTGMELHMKALKFAEDSRKITTSMSVVKLGFVTQLLEKQQDDFVCEMITLKSMISKKLKQKSCNKVSVDLNDIESVLEELFDIGSLE